MGDQRINAWLSELASRSPAPGGGSAAALSAAVAAGLAGMVANYTTGGKWADREEGMRRVAQEAAGLRAEALAAAEADVTAFGEVAAAYALPKATEADKAVRSARIQQALVRAAVPPAQTGRLAARVVGICADLVDAGNPNVVSDVAVAASVARAALESAIVNIEINSQQIRDEAEAGGLGQTVKELESAIGVADAVVRAVRGKLRT